MKEGDLVLCKKDVFDFKCVVEYPVYCINYKRPELVLMKNHCGYNEWFSTDDSDDKYKIFNEYFTTRREWNLIKLI